MSDQEFIEFDCPQCQKKLRVPANLHGKRIRCPKCSDVIGVPAETGTTVEPPMIHVKPRRLEAEPDAYDEPSREDGDDEDDDDYRIRRPRRRSAGTGVMVVAICLLVIAGLSLALDLFNCVFSIVGPVPQVNPQDPPIVQEIAKGTHGVLASGLQGVLAIMAVVTIIGSIQMLRNKSWGLALTACILSMIHIGSCCCILGLPAGVVGLIFLMNPEVKEAFS